MLQISNKIYCEEFLETLDIKTKILPNPYYDYPFMIINNFMSLPICEEITASTKVSTDVIDAKIKEHNGVLVKSDINQEIRKTKIYKLSSIHQKIYDSNFLKYQNNIETFFNIPLTTSTKVQVLQYQKGSFYKEHSDDSNVLIKDSKVIGFKVVAPQRKITSILFATTQSDISTKNNFDGGEIVFNYLYDENGNILKIKPKAGDMLLFLSNPYFTHEVLEVTKGNRVSLVQWHDGIIS